MRNCTILLSLIAMTIISSCKKEAKDDGGYIRNNTPYDLYVDIYEPNGKGFIPANMDFVRQEKVKAHSRLNLRNCGLTDGANYVYDWYSADYKHTGWMRPGGSFSYLMFNYNQWVKLDLNTNEDASAERITCLGGNGQSTIWKTVDAYDLKGNSVWKDLGARREHTLNLLYEKHVVDSNWEGASICIPNGMQNMFELTDTNRFWLTTDLYPDPDLILTSNVDFLFPAATSSTDTLFYVKRQRKYDGTYNTGNFSEQFILPVYKIVKVRTDYRATDQ